MPIWKGGCWHFPDSTHSHWIGPAQKIYNCLWPATWEVCEPGLQGTVASLTLHTAWAKAPPPAAGQGLPPPPAPHPSSLLTLDAASP